MFLIILSVTLGLLMIVCQGPTISEGATASRDPNGKVRVISYHNCYGSAQGKDIQKSLADLKQEMGKRFNKLENSTGARERKLDGKLSQLAIELKQVHQHLQTFTIPGVSNIAQGKPTSQSSTGWGGLSSRAVDGNTNGDYGKKSCSHTRIESEPWWRVDLGSSKRVARVVIYNRVDCCGVQLSNFNIRVGNSLVNNGNNNAVCASGLSLARQTMGEIHCATPLSGRYLNIQLLGLKRWLMLCEVKVYSQ